MVRMADPALVALSYSIGDHGVEEMQVAARATVDDVWGRST